MRLSVIGLRGFPMIEGGVEKHCESLYPRLEEDIDITVYRRKPYVKSSLSYERIKFIDLPSTTIKGFETLFYSFLASVDALFKKPDIVHYHNIGTSLFTPILKLRNIPVVVTYHSANYEHEKWGYFAKTLLKISEKIAFMTADKIVFVNKFQMEKCDQKVRKKAIYIPNGINEMDISQDTDYLKEIDVEPGKYILSVGRITPEKGFDVLIKGYKNANGQEYKLVIAGGVEHENAYLQKLQELSDGMDVVFTGFVYGEKLQQLYSHAGLFVLASRNEGFPLVLLEAMNYRLDVLVSDIPGTHLVSLDKDDYFKCGDYNELADKIGMRLKKTRARDYDLSEFNWNTIALEMSKVFHEVAGK